MAQYLVVGQSHLAQEIGERLRALGLDAALLALGEASPRTRDSWAPLPILEQGWDDARLPLACGLAEAEVVMVCLEDDAANLALALELAERHPRLRIQISLSHPNLAREVCQNLAASSRITAYSPEELVAPSFALSALRNGVVHGVEHRGRFLAITDRPDLPHAHKLGPGLALVEAERLTAEPELLEEVQRTAERLLNSARMNPDRFLLVLIALVGAVLGSATCFFHIHEHISWITAFYFVVTTFCTVGYGDISLKDSDALAKFVGIALMLASMTLTAGLFAILTNALVQKRADLLEGRRRFRFERHVVICGIGALGIRIADALARLRVRVLVIERSRDNEFLDELNRNQIPFMVADATRESSLDRANLRRVRSLVCCIPDDLTAFEIALSARGIRPNLHVVLRIAGDSFALRLQKAFGFHAAHSVANLAAPSVLARALAPDALLLLEIAGVWKLLVPLDAGNPGGHQPVGDPEWNLGLVDVPRPAAARRAS